MEDNDIIDANNGTITDDKTVEYTGHAPDKPILKDAKTGKFIKGTGSSGKGGRPKGAKDRVSKAMVDLATELVANRGAELFNVMADRDPAQALALVAKIISPEELRAVYAEDRAELENRVQQVNINLVSAPSPRLTDTRSQAQLTDQQRGLGSAVQRIERVAESAPEASVVATQAQADEEAARQERERQQRQRDTIRAHGGLTGRPKRREEGDVLEYPDEHTI